MKKAVFILFLVAAVLSVSACGKDSIAEDVGQVVIFGDTVFSAGRNR